MWTAPLDGSTANVQLVEPAVTGRRRLLVGRCRRSLLVLLVLWLAAATVFIVSVVRARARKAQRRRRALSRLR